MTSSANKSVSAYALSLLCLAATAIGCSWGAEDWERWAAGEVPNVRGTWIGRIQRVEVHSRNGTTYDAAELHIESGPSVPVDYPSHVEKFPGNGRWPLLVRNGRAVYSQTIDPATLPIGRRVEIKGKMLLYPVGCDGVFPVTRYGKEKGDVFEEDILDVSEEPKVLDGG
jgi:hypothetical protein